MQQRNCREVNAILFVSIFGEIRVCMINVNFYRFVYNCRPYTHSISTPTVETGLWPDLNTKSSANVSSKGCSHDSNIGHLVVTAVHRFERTKDSGQALSNYYWSKPLRVLTTIPERARTLIKSARTSIKSGHPAFANHNVFANDTETQACDQKTSGFRVM